MQKEPEQLQNTPFAPSEDSPAEIEQGIPAPSVPVGIHTEFSPQAHDRRQFTVFQVDDFVFHPTPTKTAHWAVPWSDLMMTMFILFLIMFVYQTEHKKLLVSDETEVIGGETTGALEIATADKPSASFAPIKPGLPLITAGTIKKVVPIHVQDIEVNTPFFNDNKEDQMERIKKSVEKPPPSTPAKKVADTLSTPADTPAETEIELLTDQGTAEPQPIPTEQTEVPGDEKIKKLLGTISNTLTRYNLGKYASADLVSGAAVRITLSSDLFFTVDKADLTSKSMAPLQKIGAAIKGTPFHDRGRRSYRQSIHAF